MGSAWLKATSIFDTPLDSSIIDTICQDLKTNVFAQDNLDDSGPSRASWSQSQYSCTDSKQFKWHDELLFFKNILYVNDRSMHLASKSYNIAMIHIWLGIWYQHDLEFATTIILVTSFT
mgnify:FL=1